MARRAGGMSHDQERSQQIPRAPALRSALPPARAQRIERAFDQSLLPAGICCSFHSLKRGCGT